MKKIIESGMKKYFRMRRFKYKLWKENQCSTQALILQDLLHTAQYTEFGQKYGFENISDYNQFCTSVPVSTYEDLFPYIEKMLDGQADILWSGVVKFFSKSSGTTNDVSKYIPVSDAALHKNNYKAGKDLYTIFFESYPNSNLFQNQGSTLSLGGSLANKNEKGIVIGDVSAIMMSQLPGWAAQYREPSLDVALMSQWQEKIPAIAKDLVGKNITHISGVPTWFVSLFDHMLDNNPGKNLQDLFPNIELFVHGAVSFEPYRQIFQNFFPQKNMKYLEVYNASEGFFAIQDQPEKPGEMLLLTDHGVFYEFIPMATYGTNDQVCIQLSQVQVGVDYAMLISTNAGLWRYDIGDTVCFTSVDPYRIKISGRTKHFINIFGEELMVGNADSAIAAIAKKYNIEIAHYTAGPIFMNTQGKGGHEWIIECKASYPENMQEFAGDLDAVLQSVNSDYATKRQDNIALQLPVIHFVATGTFEKWMEQRGKLGGQHKVPRLSNKRTFIEEILKIT